MKPAPWLVELHRLWYKARGGRLGANVRPFSCDWISLLNSAGIRSGEDEAMAVKEALKLRKEGIIVLKSHGVRDYLIERITVPLASEAWLRAQFGGVEAVELQRLALAHVASAKAAPHSRFPQLWIQWCASLQEAFENGRSLHPLSWKRPEEVSERMSLVRSLTETEWLSGISIRTVSMEIGLDSKGLEGRRAAIESCLAALFGNVTSLLSLGITGSASHVWLAGPLVLQFEDGGCLDHSSTQGRYSVDHVDFLRVKSITTTAKRLLTVENQKASFRDLVAANTDRSTLIAASSFPTEAMKLLLNKLPLELPHYHFGDTDPPGWDILRTLREVSPKPVLPLHMRWRGGALTSPITERDRMILHRLLEHPSMQNCRAEMEAMLITGDRGSFEQESFGMPVGSWPFY